MAIGESLLYEFDHEMGNTRKMLEAIPNDKLSFKPHEKGWEMSALVTHMVTSLDWGATTMTTPSFDFTGFQPPEPVKSREEAIAIFEKGVQSLRSAITGASDESFSEGWTLSGNGQTFFTMPRMAVLRSFVFNHLIHHRAQLSVYLRLVVAKVPGMYGPSGDETM